ncbi:MAG TPA: hypothetical protein VED46_16250 [Alphaproteobacteria bacterium]|nr:hypothetical protein [Alphaproteobacteria bacterium]
MEADLYTSDIRKAAADPSAELTVPAILLIPIPSADECSKYTSDITAIAASSLRNFRPGSCKKIDFNSFLEAAVDVPLLYVDPEKFEVNAPQDSILTFVAVKSVEPKGSVLGLLIDQKRFSSLQEQVRREYFQTLSLEQARATFVVTNDEPGTQRYRVGSVFRDGEPIPFPEEFELERRQKTKLVVSDVWISKLARGAVIWPASVLDPSAE